MAYFISQGIILEPYDTGRVNKDGDPIYRDQERTYDMYNFYCERCGSWDLKYSKVADHTAGSYPVWIVVCSALVAVVTTLNVMITGLAIMLSIVVGWIIYAIRRQIGKPKEQKEAEYQFCCYDCGFTFTYMLSQLHLQTNHNPFNYGDSTVKLRKYARRVIMNDDSRLEIIN